MEERIEERMGESSRGKERGNKGRSRMDERIEEIRAETKSCIECLLCMQHKYASVCG